MLNHGGWVHHHGPQVKRQAQSFHSSWGFGYGRQAHHHRPQCKCHDAGQHVWTKIPRVKTNVDFRNPRSENRNGFRCGFCVDFFGHNVSNENTKINSRQIHADFHPGFHTGFQTGFHPGFHTGFRTGFHTGVNTGFHTGVSHTELHKGDSARFRCLRQQRNQVNKCLRWAPPLHIAIFVFVSLQRLRLPNVEEVMHCATPLIIRGNRTSNLLAIIHHAPPKS